MTIREARDSEVEATLEIYRAAFGQKDESDLVQNLLRDESAQPFLSLLAFEKDMPAGHILFTNAWLEPATDVRCSLLAPLAVLPEYQKKGVGGALIEKGLEILTERGVGLVFVLGYPEYYTRYGFEPAGRQGLDATYPIAEKNADAWMVRALQPKLLGSCQGKLICADAINRQEYWVE